MKINSLAQFIILILITATVTSVWYYWGENNDLSKKPVFTPPPLRLFTDQAAGTLTLAGIISETNRHREEHDMIALRENEFLNEAAAIKAQDILDKQYFDHVSPEGLGPADVVDQTAYTYLSVGENLALGNFQDDDDVVQAWMDSPGHRENILSSGFTEIGVAAIKGEFEGREAWVGVQMFGLPQSACPTPDTNIRSRFDQAKKNIDSAQTELNHLKQELDDEATALSKLQTEINDLAKRGQAKVQEGNEDIRRGNEIYEETGDRQKAQPYWDRGEAKQKEGNALIEEAKQKQKAADAMRSALNAKRDDYNQRVSTFKTQADNLKNLSTTLNNQIRSYNNCLEEYN